MKLNEDQALTPAEWQELADDYGLAMHDASRPLIRQIAVSELLDPRLCADYIGWLAEYIGAPSLRVAASMLAKRYGYLLIAPSVYAMTAYDKALLPEPRQCLLITPDPATEPGRTTFPDLALTGLQVVSPGPAGRAAWRESWLRELFRGHLTPLLQSLAAVSQTPRAVLWENIYVRIAPLLTEDFDEAPSRRRTDAAYLLADAAPELFGERRHPFARFVPKADCGGLAAAGSAERLTCCFYYEMSDEYCRKCPKPTQK